MNSAPLNGGLVRVEVATPKQVALVAQALGAGDGLAGVVLLYRGRAGGGDVRREAAGRAEMGLREEGILVLGSLRYRPGFEDVWAGGTHYDLRGRRKAQLCLQYLVEKEAIDASSARHFVNEIDPYVREKGDFPPLPGMKIGNYFNDRRGMLPRLRRELIASAGRNGCYFLSVGVSRDV